MCVRGVCVCGGGRGGRLKARLLHVRRVISSEYHGVDDNLQFLSTADKTLIICLRKLKKMIPEDTVHECVVFTRAVRRQLEE